MARAQQSAAQPLIGFLSTRSPEEAAIHTNAFRRGLEEMGYVEGRSVAIEYRWAKGDYSQLPPFVADLFSRPLSLMVTAGDPAKRGWELFNGKARCQLCHALTDNQPDTTLFMDNDFHNIGIGILGHHVAPLAQQAERELAQGRLEPIDTASITF